MKRYKITLYILIIIITYLSLTPLPLPQPDIDNWDKINHTVAFAALTYFAHKSYRTAFIKIFLPLLAYGLLIECIQYFIPNRFFSLADIAADVLGIIIIYIFIRYISIFSK